jgi:acyl-coenzyme A thioesterase PaaI-like protein
VVATASPLHTGRTTQVWDATVTNETSERLMASYRCTQLILY